jgi:methionyl aminopeptidase
MVHIKTEDQVKLMQEAALLVSKTLTQVATILKPGMSTLDVDQFCMQFVKDHNATLSFYNYHGH